MPASTPTRPTRGSASCQGCHGADLTGGTTGFSCALCHDTASPAGVASWKVNCVMCHGGTGNQTGAPPKTTWGNSADTKRVGAHATHVTANARSPAFDCDVCHVKPADALAAGHVDATPTAEMTWGGIAVTSGAAPAWNRTAATCSNTYCHGRFTNGNATNGTRLDGDEPGAPAAPATACRPGGTHPAVGTALTGCAACHNQTMTAAGALIAPIAGGKHLDGDHPRHLRSRRPPRLVDGHRQPGIPRLLGQRRDLLLPELPRRQPGRRGRLGHDFLRHLPRRHLEDELRALPRWHGQHDRRSAQGNLGLPHRRGPHRRPHQARDGRGHLRRGRLRGLPRGPADAVAPGHLDGPSATVTWGGIAGASNAVPAWNRSTGTCASTYCHGGYSGSYAYYFWGDAVAPYAGANATPKWTDPPMTCTSCHGNPPNNANWHSGAHGGGNGCNLCHPHVNATGTAILNPALHINGIVEVQGAFKSSCFNCH